MGPCKWIHYIEETENIPLRSVELEYRFCLPTDLHIHTVPYLVS